MKRKRILTVLGQVTLSIFLTVCTQNVANAAGGSDGGNANGGGGGDAVVFHLGEAHIADTYSKIDVYHDQEIHFSEQLKEKLGEIDVLRRSYLVRAADDSLTISDFRVAFYATEEFPNNPICSRRLQYTEIPENARVEQVACTVGSETWIKMSLFERMSQDDQALILFHEALRRNGVDDLTISTVINGMMIVVKNAHLQEEHDNLQALSESDQLMVRRMFRSLQIAYGANPAEARKIYNGHIITPYGGIFHGTGEQFENLQAGVVVGIGSYVEVSSVIGENTILVDTNICRKSCTIGSGTVIKSVYGLELLQLDGVSRNGLYWELTKSDNKNVIRIGSHVVIKEAKFELNRKIIFTNTTYVGIAPSFTVGDNSNISNWTIIDFPDQKLDIGPNVKLNAFNVQISFADIQIDPNTEISGLKISRISNGRTVNFSGSILGNSDTQCNLLDHDGNSTSQGLLSNLFSSSTGPIKVNSLAAVLRDCSGK